MMRIGTGDLFGVMRVRQDKPISRCISIEFVCSYFFGTINGCISHKRKYYEYSQALLFLCWVLGLLVDLVIIIVSVILFLIIIDIRKKLSNIFILRSRHFRLNQLKSMPVDCVFTSWFFAFYAFVFRLTCC